MGIFEWMNKEGHPDGWLAKQLGISKPAVSGYKHKKTNPSLKLAIKIHKLTNGEVSYEDMLASYTPETKNELEDL